MTANANASTPSGAISITLIVMSSVTNPDSRAISYHRSDNGNTETLALDASATDADVQTALQALADSLVHQNAVSADVVGQTFTGTATGTSGTFSVTIRALSALSHADSLSVQYVRVDTHDVANIAANTDVTTDDLRTLLQATADSLAQQAQTASDAAQGVVGLTVTANA